jgi:hypothetical protein
MIKRTLSAKQAEMKAAQALRKQLGYMPYSQSPEDKRRAQIEKMIEDRAQAKRMLESTIAHPIAKRPCITGSALCSEVYQDDTEPYSGVYLIGSTKHEWYKVGQSQALSRRLVGYRSLPFLIDVRCTWQVPEEDCRRIEKRIHRLVESRRTRANDGYSEWYNLTRDDIANIEMLMENYEAFDHAQPDSVI